MEKFKGIINRRIKLLSGGVLVIIAISVCGFFIDKERLTDGIVQGFQSGILLALGVLSLIQIIKLRMTVKDNKKLKMLYNQEQDERMKVIRCKAGMPMLLIMSVTMLLAAIITGYFNIIVFYTLVITAMVQLLVGTLVKVYYMKTM